MKTLRWVAARLLFALSLAFTFTVWITVASTLQEFPDQRLSVLVVAGTAVLCYAGFLACWFTPERRNS